MKVLALKRCCGAMVFSPGEVLEIEDGESLQELIAAGAVKPSNTADDRADNSASTDEKKPKLKRKG
jgi:hypothetical protein